ncbi:hypothetical protein AN8774.2 [Aspergillus nidulans FGSC A4]|uniref:C6 transcription factor, putative (AFU_orthologue AFUA_3G03900) n=1 Tax=Emericella nidulans (strain FGSC A4 / ATCC 38163 / CBS 112.46 / NRRL 194 / M139) TaxID=227321 RepID=Q5ASF6_EMENI|nr:hypothetical protein [Aspergillus nidulans FGSC A4]EAA60567.1 hypothetical protein AN8774.2 [Aspergillus nidulans FGSC A4]CBF78046.1 TPA: C6 transcription factor, putative (AFU_orthologue; AFUA_3G03900) [Aspergillus nidulans FGSC A4]|eukprot:XP_682043.1 hypothetical protein AN8774.2 [Aspergillus nidulans FGSC A4]
MAVRSCDEIKPSCSRCILTMQKCVYAAPAATTQSSGPASNTQRNQLSLSSLLPTTPTSPGGRLSPSPLPFEAPQLPFSPPGQQRQQQLLLPTRQTEIDSSDTGLYHHYLQHTSRNLTANRQDHHAIQICLPTLALRSRTVYHSMLALSAACMCCDLIYREPPPEVTTVSEILMTGYRHYNLASERLRELISRPSAANAEPLLAAPPLLVPFVTSSQQVNHWISNRTAGGVEQVRKRLSSTPRDVIVISRGISATVRALETSTSPYSQLATPEALDSLDEYGTVAVSPCISTSVPPSHSHPMYPIIKSTSQPAFAKLQDRISLALVYDPGNRSLATCADAFKVLSTLRTGVFPQDQSSPPLLLPPSMTQMPTLPQVAPWLVSFTARPSTPSPTDHMTRPLLSFLVHAPQAYLDFVLPLLDQRLEGPAPSETGSADKAQAGLELNVEQALALDIYAHWSVLMFLVSEESWWIGKLPDITLAGLVNRFGDNFVRKHWPDDGGRVDGEGEGEGIGEWWPGSMLRIHREIGRYRS